MDDLEKAIEDLYPDLIAGIRRRSDADAALLLKATRNLALVAATEGAEGFAEATKAYESTVLQLVAAKDAQVRRAVNDFGRRVAALSLALLKATA